MTAMRCTPPRACHGAYMWRGEAVLNLVQMHLSGSFAVCVYNHVQRKSSLLKNPEKNYYVICSFLRSFLHPFDRNWLYCEFRRLSRTPMFAFQTALSVFSLSHTHLKGKQKSCSVKRCLNDTTKCIGAWPAGICCGIRIIQLVYLEE